MYQILKYKNENIKVLKKKLITFFKLLNHFWSEGILHKT